MNSDAKVVGQPRRYSGTYWLAIASVIGIFVVNTLGFTDTITGSAMGCGRNWPLCNGQWIPSSWNMATLIEYVHRVSVLVGGGLLIVFSVVAWWKYGRVRYVRLLVCLSLLGVVLEGGLGALAVLFVNPPAVMAAHMGIALISFVSVCLLAAVIGRADRSRHSNVNPIPIRDSADLKQFARLSLWLIPYAYLAIYVGAYVASTGTGGSFQGWPFPTESYAQVGMAFWIDILHRSVALVYLLLTIRLAALSYRFRRTRPAFFKASHAALGLVCVQAISGGIMIATHLNVWAFLFHVTNVSLLFAVQCYLGFEVMQERRIARDITVAADFRRGLRHRTGA